MMPRTDMTRSEEHDPVLAALERAAPYMDYTPRPVEGDTASMAPAEPNALARFIAELEAWERSGNALCEIENEVSFSEGVCLCLHELKRLRALTACQPRCEQGEREAIRHEIVNTPETADFMAGVPIEAIHQRERWGSNHDAGKTPFDWFWLIGYLAQKAADAATRGDLTKAQHHTISTAAALANWHAALSGADTSMRPGIDPDERGIAALTTPTGGIAEGER